jgi:hypothetical protein
MALDVCFKRLSTSRLWITGEGVILTLILFVPLCAYGWHSFCQFQVV